MSSFETLKKIVYQKDYEKFLTTVTGKEEEIEKIDLLPITNYKKCNTHCDYCLEKYFLENYKTGKNYLQPISADEVIEKCPIGTVVVTVDNGIAAANVLERLEANGYPV